MRQIAKLVVVQILRAYKWAISPMLPPSCRFVPTCSEYAMEAVDRYGVLRGGFMALTRLLRCHPFAHAGYDPVVKDGNLRLEEERGATTRDNATASKAASSRARWKIWWNRGALANSPETIAISKDVAISQSGTIWWKSGALAPRHVLRTLMGFSPRARLLHLKRNA